MPSTPDDPVVPAETDRRGAGGSRPLRHPHLRGRRESPDSDAGDRGPWRHDSRQRRTERPRPPRRAAAHPPRRSIRTTTRPCSRAGRGSASVTPPTAPAVQLTAGGVPKLALTNPYFGDLEVPATTIPLQLQVPFAGHGHHPGLGAHLRVGHPILRLCHRLGRWRHVRLHPSGHALSDPPRRRLRLVRLRHAHSRAAD